MMPAITIEYNPVSNTVFMTLQKYGIIRKNTYLVTQQ